MNHLLIHKSSGVNGSICGRGLARRKLSPHQRAVLAADVVTGGRQFDPSLAQAAALFGVTVAQVRDVLQARAIAEDDPCDVIVTAWEDASELEREIALRTIGVAAVWDVLARVVP